VRFSWPLLAVVCLASAAALHFTANHLSINTSTVDMLSEDLPFRQNFKVLDEAFPLTHRTIILVVEAETADGAAVAAERLAQALRGRSDRFHSVFYPEAEPFFRRNGLLFLDLEELYALADQLAEAQPLLAALHADMSLRGLSGLLSQALENLADANGRGEELPAGLEATLVAVAAAVENVADGEPAQVAWQDVLGAAPRDTANGTRKVMVLEPVLDYASLQPAAQAEQAIQETLRDLGLTPDKNVRVRMTGELLMLQDEMKSVQKGVGFVGLLSFVVVLVILLIGLRSLPLIVAIVFTLVIGLIWTAFFAAVAIGELNLISVTFAVLFIGLSVDFGIHFALRYREGVDAGVEHRPALEQAAAGVGGALLLSAAAAAIGFLSFLPTSYRGLSELGLISSAGMLVALVANLSVLPALLSRLPLKAAALGRRTAGGNRLLSIVERWPRTVVATALSLSVVAALALPFARFDDDPLNLRDRDSASVAALLDLLQDPRIDPYEAQALAPDRTSARELAARLEALPEVREVTTLLDLVPADQEDKLDVIGQMASFMAPILAPAPASPPSGPVEDHRAIERLKAAAAVAGDGGVSPGAARLAAALKRLGMSEPDLRHLEDALIDGFPRLLAQLGEALGADRVAVESLPATLTKRLRTPDGRLLLTIAPARDLRDRQERRRFVDAVQGVVPSATGEAIIVTEAGQAVIQAFREAGLYAGLLVFALLLVVLRSLLDALLIMVPLGMAMVMTVAATVVLGMPFNFANVIVVPLLFGLGVAGGVHIVMRARTEASGGVLGTYTPRAVVLSALTTIGSFGALALSSHPGTSSMGIMLTISIGLATICTVLVLPALRQVAANGRQPPP